MMPLLFLDKHRLSRQGTITVDGDIFQPHMESREKDLFHLLHRRLMRQIDRFRGRFVNHTVQASEVGGHLQMRLRVDLLCRFQTTSQFGR